MIIGHAHGQIFSGQLEIQDRGSEEGFELHLQIWESQNWGSRGLCVHQIDLYIHVYIMLSIQQ